ncbi:hypothetical protein AB1Y20_022662 [Prymnesium parvum]|uniref:Uncharacterized protein n=1 Tax=Prymnesium parvum TaxID=97485 RepID=A0AB34JJG5_PRYPA
MSAFWQQVHTGKPSIVRPPRPPPDGQRVRLVAHAAGCSAPPASSLANASFYGGVVHLEVDVPRRYTLCELQGAQRAVVHLEAVRPPKPTFDCAAHFGRLCPAASTSSLPPEDISLARAARLRLYVYTETPPSFHEALFTSEAPPDVRDGRVCDFVRGPCTPAPPADSKRGYKTELVRWFTGMKHAADIPLLAKLLALASVPGIRTLDPRRADLFVVPFLGGFIERDSPDAAYRLNRQAHSGNGVMRQLFRHLVHYNASTAARHLFLLTNSCGGCNRQACDLCNHWQSVPAEVGCCDTTAPSCGPRLAFTLGPNSPRGARTSLRQVLVPPNIMEEEFHTPRWIPLCRTEGASAGGQRDSFRPALSSSGCRKSSAREGLLLFYQGMSTPRRLPRRTTVREK